MNRFKIQAPIGREHPHKGVVEKIETGDTPVIVFMNIQKSIFNNNVNQVFFYKLKPHIADQTKPRRLYADHFWVAENPLMKVYAAC